MNDFNGCVVFHCLLTIPLSRNGGVSTLMPLRTVLQCRSHCECARVCPREIPGSGIMELPGMRILLVNLVHCPFFQCLFFF